MHIRIEVLTYAETVIYSIHVHFIYNIYLVYFLYIYIYMCVCMYIINSPKRRDFGLGISYIYIVLIDGVAFLCNTWVKRQK
jgi:sensor histidine kinase regulating citrate/malate metabolism